MNKAKNWLNEETDISMFDKCKLRHTLVVTNKFEMLRWRHHTTNKWHELWYKDQSAVGTLLIGRCQTYILRIVKLNKLIIYSSYVTQYVLIKKTIEKKQDSKYIKFIHL